ncbi:DUF4422 domain-containing protein [Gemella cuniculi]|uniref:DUF4422 domain-containing protein n=1 Tax=Gemella cuniculi TaxID=150240 RepID=UPI0003FD5A78|nr:DUF4422 domain-containing protein [Gemella cuniculi]
MKHNFKILAASHKSFSAPKDSIYLPIQVGAEGKESIGYIQDNTGDNISKLNPYFCELTGIYWAWKNLDSEYIGLDHYRRYFSNRHVKYKNGMDINKYVLSREDVKFYLEQADILVPKKRKYYIETLYSHYSNTFDGKHLDNTRLIIEEVYPEYLSSFDKVMKQRSGYMFNMFIMKKEYLDEYCSWLFDILFRLQKIVDVTELTPFEARLFGRVSELLFNVWLEQKGYKTNEVPYLNAFEVNWLKKGSAFLRAKFLKKKYKESF